jgi:hypothetical protein
VNEASSMQVKKVLSILSYLPIILLGIAGSVVVVDMWQIAGVGRTKVTAVKNEHDGAFSVKPSAIKSPTPSGSPQTP